MYNSENLYESMPPLNLAEIEGFATNDPYLYDTFIQIQRAVTGLKSTTPASATQLPIPEINNFTNPDFYLYQTLVEFITIINNVYASGGSVVQPPITIPEQSFFADQNPLLYEALVETAQAINVIPIAT